MKAIEILFKRINDLSLQIQQTKDIKDKVSLAVEIGETAKVIREMYELSRFSGEYI